MIENTQQILDELAKNGQTLADLEKRLEAIDSKLAGVDLARTRLRPVEYKIDFPLFRW